MVILLEKRFSIWGSFQEQLQLQLTAVIAIIQWFLFCYWISAWSQKLSTNRGQQHNEKIWVKAKSFHLLPTLYPQRIPPSAPHSSLTPHALHPLPHTPASHLTHSTLCPTLQPHTSRTPPSAHIPDSHFSHSTNHSHFSLTPHTLNQSLTLFPPHTLNQSLTLFPPHTLLQVLTHSLTPPPPHTHITHTAVTQLTHSLTPVPHTHPYSPTHSHTHTLPHTRPTHSPL
ncbi:hypothetical protein Pcinc_028826 [Petrolisthes cinctipes]|uniref:Uncharacterized protein n=1 Tax=Petrolisthes cinctipes TaxID=88211 RepID=A0AAE1F2E2_PETCI|nr:hypothetical protein Pcinc_028826 [Petrolisthes cinctipes]